MPWTWRGRAPARLRYTLITSFVGGLLPAGTGAVPTDSAICVEDLERVTELALPHRARIAGLAEHNSGSRFRAMFVSRMPKQGRLRLPAVGTGRAVREDAVQPSFPRTSEICVLVRASKPNTTTHELSTPSPEASGRPVHDHSSQTRVWLRKLLPQTNYLRTKQIS